MLCTHCNVCDAPEANVHREYVSAALLTILDGWLGG
jgi:hypothetical protein